ncbi:PAS and ANTAR domain-containing protein [Amycolatopsis sp. H20-H5]|uniref:PAS and ANTAR domain-containing protein n=1 Tax=Amycolatopsis sp. H20-H5 TaxID=3046309 RepID=UPI002DBFDF83|nr:PAS and ANTAR domain-containing protein [Amycolatopsis sp. H20-H5]MEC3976706.1 PAS and ANTAR domain-containing protein [Amycolatopsis sp. H20-H5]
MFPAWSEQGNELTDELAGLFHFDLATAGWRWSPEVFLILGYPPGSTEPSAELLGPLAEVVERAARGGEPFSVRHRLVTVDGRVVPVLVVGEAERDGEGRVVAVHGCFVDLDGRRSMAAEQRDEAVNEAAGLHRAMASRAIIEQAKGMIMLAYGCDAATAFELLIEASQRSNTKLHTLATRLVTEMETGKAQPEAARQHLERVFLRLGRKHSSGG